MTNAQNDNSISASPLSFALVCRNWTTFLLLEAVCPCTMKSGSDISDTAPLNPIRVADVYHGSCDGRKYLSGKCFLGTGVHWLPWGSRGVFNGERESGTCSRQGQRPVLGMFWHWIGGRSVQSSTETYQPQVREEPKGPERGCGGVCGTQA